MKKILATILALVMVFSLSVSAMADTITSVTENNTSTGTVEVTVTEGVNDKIVYSVTVAWDDTEMEYQTEGEGTWDPSTHTYTGATEEKWVDDEATVTVTNHSNAGVTATIAADESNTLTYTFDKSTFDLVTAEGTEVNAAPNDAFTITAASTPTATVTDTFTVTITAAAPAEPVELDPYPVYANDYWIDEGQQTEFDDVAVNQEIEFHIGSYSQQLSGNNDDYAYLYSATVTEGEAANMELVNVEHGYNIKFTQAGTYKVEAEFKTIDGNGEFITVTLTFTVQ